MVLKWSLKPTLDSLYFSAVLRHFGINEESFFLKRKKNLYLYYKRHNFFYDKSKDKIKKTLNIFYEKKNSPEKPVNKVSYMYFLKLIKINVIDKKYSYIYIFGSIARKI